MSRPIPPTGPQPDVAYRGTVNDRIRLRRQYGGAIPGRQRQRATRRHEDIRIDWDNAQEWRSRGVTYPIRSMRDDHLWHGINWIVRNVEYLFIHAGGTANDKNLMALSARVWLRDRILFRAMVREAVRRDMTFPPDVFQYLKRYVLDRSDTIDGYEPWRDPECASEAEALRPLLEQPLRVQETAKKKRTVVL